MNVRWRPSTQFKSLINEACFNYVGTREAQAEARKAEKEALNNEATIKPGEEPDDEGGTDDSGAGDGNL